MRIATVIVFIVLLAGCRKLYNPPAINRSHQFLVVEGLINASPGGVSTIYLSRTKNVNDSVIFNPEFNAHVIIESGNGNAYQLNPIAQGVYRSAPLTLNQTQLFRIRIQTADGSQYFSEFEPVKIAPPIDSLTWEYNHDVNVFVHAKDASANTRFYRWDYTETWEYHAFYETNLGYRNGQLYFKDSSELLSVCYDSSRSNNIVLGSTIALTHDIIDGQRVLTVPHGSEKISHKYSVLVRQYALTEKAFRFWELLKKISEEGGSFFDAQPARLSGNIRKAGDEGETVIGYIGASTVSEYRIFIRRPELPGWQQPPTTLGCEPIILSVNDAYYYLNDPSYAPAYYVGSGGGAIAVARVQCVDCTKRGGTTRRPPYWR